MRAYEKKEGQRKVKGDVKFTEAGSCLTVSVVYNMTRMDPHFASART